MRVPPLYKRLLFFLIAFGVSVPAIRSAPLKPTTLEYAAIADAAVGLRPELSADIILRLIESGKISDQKRLLQLLDTLEATAAQAALPMRLLYVGRGMDTEPARLASASRLRLDQQSIRLRVSRALLPVNPARARRLFEQAATALVPRMGCDQPLVYDASEVYPATPQILGSFSAAERRKGEDVELLRRLASSISFLSQAAPLAKLLATAQLPFQARADAIHAFSVSLAALSPTGWEFSAAHRQQRLGPELGELIARMQQEGTSAVGLLTSYREVLSKSVSNGSCPDSPMAATTKMPVELEAIQYFNQTLRASAPDSVPEVRLDSAKFIIREDRMKNPQLPEPVQFEGLLHKLYQLREGAGVSEAEGWEQDAQKFLDHLEEWKTVPGECGIRLFHQKSTLYRMLIDVTPGGSMQNKTIDRYLAFLSQDAAQTQSPIEWLSEFQWLLRMTRSADAAGSQKLDQASKKGMRLNQLPNGAANDILESLARSSNSAMAMYARLERISPLAFDLPAGL